MIIPSGLMMVSKMMKMDTVMLLMVPNMQIKEEYSIQLVWKSSTMPGMDIIVVYLHMDKLEYNTNIIK